MAKKNEFRFRYDNSTAVGALERTIVYQILDVATRDEALAWLYAAVLEIRQAALDAACTELQDAVVAGKRPEYTYPNPAMEDLVDEIFKFQDEANA